jgi:hypothetical protein
MLKTFLTENRKTIVEQWTRQVFETYPPDTSNFLGSQKDRFANPVGYTISTEISSLFDQLTNEMDREDVLVSVDNILKIRAVQDFSPGQAVEFCFALKNVVRSLLMQSSPDIDMMADLLEFESRIDSLALFAFETYMNCRERIHQIRTNEIRKRSVQMADRCDKRDAETQE